MLDPVARAIANAPINEEILTARAEASLAEAAAWAERNKAIPHEQVLAELGISQEEIGAYREPR